MYDRGTRTRPGRSRHEHGGSQAGPFLGRAFSGSAHVSPMGLARLENFTSRSAATTARTGRQRPCSYGRSQMVVQVVHESSCAHLIQDSVAFHHSLLGSKYVGASVAFHVRHCKIFIQLACWFSHVCSPM